jgi:hypothetical protein
MMYNGYTNDTQTIIMRLDWRNCKLIFDTPIKGTNGLYEHIFDNISAVITSPFKIHSKNHFF